jgi:hypothetical protein
VEEFKCAFSATLMGNDFACDQALPVTRRGGPDIACQAQASHARCEKLFAHLKAAALPAMGFTDDLTSTPHSALVKIQFGGLLGVQRLLDGHSCPKYPMTLGPPAKLSKMRLRTTPTQPQPEAQREDIMQHV